MPSREDLETELAVIAQHRRVLQGYEPECAKLDAWRARVEAKLRALDAPPAVPAAPSRFGHSIEGGIESIWIKGISGNRLIHGVASSPTVNSHNYALLSRGCSARLPVPILSAHAEGPSIGEVFLLRKSDRQIYIQGRIWDHGEAADAAWALVASGEVRSFSGAAGPGARVQGVVDGVTYYDQWTLREVSICREGANPDCYFEIYKPGDGHPLSRGASWPDASPAGQPNLSI